VSIQVAVSAREVSALLLPAGPPSIRPTPAIVTPPFGPRIAIGAIGVLTAVIMSAVNYYSTDINMADIQGGLLIGHDEAAWSMGVFEAGMVVGMTFSPWCAVTFTLRRVCLLMTTLMALIGVLRPFAANIPAFYVLSAAQGLSGGALTPLLITVALRYCPPHYRLYGFAAYALSSNFGPNMSLPAAAWSSDYGGLFGIFWNIVPFCAVSLAAIAYGLPKDPLRLDRFTTFDWLGVLTGAFSIAALTIAVTQGDRLNWFSSRLFSLLTIGGGLLFCFFLLNEWFHPAPIFKLQILGRRNFLFSVIGIIILVIVFLGVIVIPIDFLSELKGYRPADVAVLALIIALPQLIILPLVSALLNIERVDCRWVFAIGFGLVAYSCYLGTFITSDWVRNDFYFIVALLSVGEALAILPILMLVVADMPPDDGPYISAMFNSMKGFASVAIFAIIEGFGRLRTEHHSSILVSRLGQHPAAYQERLGIFDGDLANAIGDPGTRADVSLEMLVHQVHVQSHTLAMADLYRLLLLVTLVMICLTAFLPTRVRPPRAVAPR
jgi:DHA2 family multidrug resistance protein